MFHPKCSIFCPLFILFSLIQMPALAEKKSYIVYMGSHSHHANSKVVLHKVSDYHIDFLASFLGSKEKAKDSIYYSYRRHINGFAAILDEEVAAKIAKHKMVASVFQDRISQLHTTRSWNFLSLEKNGIVGRSSLWKKANFGEDVIIGNLDSGVWPESKSFSDEGYGPVPARWKGICQNDTIDGVHCNRKLIGARHFNEGYDAQLKLKNVSHDPSQRTARDHNGHGTHTLSTAGGNFVAGASVSGLFYGTAKGGSPRARVAAYKVCWENYGCLDSDIIKAFDRAIDDGVDVLSVSLGGEPTAYFNNGVAVGSFHAVKHGIPVIASGGNSGPIFGSIDNVAPWIITVGASTTDRRFINYVQLRNGLRLKGTSISKPLPGNRYYPIVVASQVKVANSTEEDALECLKGTLDPKKVKGKIVVCQQGNGKVVDKGYEALLAGAVGMILYNNEDSGSEIDLETHVITASHINYTAGLALLAYINSTKNPMALITAATTELGIKHSPVMASFSSRGPNTITPEILKPDITAPGVDIVAAYTEAVSPTHKDYDKQRTSFSTSTGTSMSCPHVAGVVGLLKAIHPDWSPAAIRSAIMTTATTGDNTGGPILESDSGEGTPFSYGAGHIQPNLAADPGLVYDLKVKSYKDFICAHGYNQSMIEYVSNSNYKCPKTPINILNLNYPSITVPKLSVSGSVTVSRTLKNVGSPAIYAARVNEPPGISVKVEPDVLIFKRVGKQKKFNLTIMDNGFGLHGIHNEYVFGDLIWADDKHIVRSPISVAIAAPINATKTHQ